eukprot:scaffold60441_cov39-Attheya_sp.AAC.1
MVDERYDPTSTLAIRTSTTQCVCPFTNSSKYEVALIPFIIGRRLRMRACIGFTIAFYICSATRKINGSSCTAPFGDVARVARIINEYIQ